jgi:hypothetical protein
MIFSLSDKAMSVNGAELVHNDEGEVIEEGDYGFLEYPNTEGNEEEPEDEYAEVLLIYLFSFYFILR